MIRRPPRSPLFPYTPLFRSALAGIGSYLAVESGWVTTEVGRQPWIVYGVMRVSDAVTGAPAAFVWTMLSVLDRKSTRLNSSHSQISYAVFCLKKKNIRVGRRPYNITPVDLRFSRQPLHIDPVSSCPIHNSGR